MSKEEQTVPFCNNSLEPLNVSHLITNPLPQHAGITPLSSEARNDSGYDDILVCSFNGISELQGHCSDSELCTKGLATKLSFASLSSSCSDAYYCAGSESSVLAYESGKPLSQITHNDSGICNKSLATKLSFGSLSSSSSDAYCYAGSESSTVSHKPVQSSNNLNFQTIHRIVNLPVSTPAGYGTHCQYQIYQHQPLNHYYLTKLNPLQSYAAPLENTHYYNSNHDDLSGMVISP